MRKVICVECKDIGYTASPDYARCRCRGRLVVMDEQVKEGNE